MNNNQKTILDDLASTLEKIKTNKVYGSVEIYFEDGEITQITQRIINKVKKSSVKSSSSEKNVPHRNNQNASQRITLSTLE